MPVANCPPEARALMTVPVKWEKSLGTDGYGQPVYDLPQTLYCWLEHHATGGLESVRKPDGTSVDIEYDLYFAGDDPNVRSMTMQDRLTLPVVAGSALTTQPLFISTIFGPNFDNRYPWLVEVMV